MLMYQTNPVGVELLSYVNTFFSFFFTDHVKPNEKNFILFRV